MRMLMIMAVTIGVATSVAGMGEDVTRKRFPDADSVLLEEVEDSAYQSDGCYETMSESWTKILTEKGRRGESSVTLDYSKRYSEAAIEYVGIIGTDGSERAVDMKATTRESTDNSSFSANIYDPLDRKIVCTVPGLGIGETLHVKTRRKITEPRFRDQWSDMSISEWTHPILKSTWKIRAPKERPLKKIAIRNPLGNMVTNLSVQTDGTILYTFTATNSAQTFPEPDMPPMYTQVQSVRVSTAANWSEISKWYWGVCEPHLMKTNSALVAKSMELGNVRAIFRFVSQEIRYMGLTLEDKSPGYAPHDVDITFDNRFGVCRDKAGLLVAMLRAAGYRAFPVLINVGAKLDEEVPQPFFNHAIVAVERVDKAGEYDLMDPTNENTKELLPSYLSNLSYLVCRPEGERLMTSPVIAPETNRLAIKSTGSLAPDGGMFLESQLDFGGINDTLYRGALVKMVRRERKRFFERVVKKLSPGAELVKCEITPEDMRDTETPMSVKLFAKLPEMMIRGVTRSELAMPFLSRTLGIVNYTVEGSTSLVKRKYPLVMDTTAMVSESVEIEVGDAVGEARDMPEAISQVEGGYRYARSFCVTGGVLRAERSLTLAELEFSPAEYEDLREEIKDIEAAERKCPVFSENRLEDADVRVLLHATDVNIVSERAWTVTNHVIKEVLTYAGKKKSSELKYPYNPLVGETRLLSATVSNRNGNVSAVTSREMNVMDAEWVAEAPRYAASKMLVVNLPAVEIGSVIDLITVTEITNSPVAYYGEFGFDSQEPLERREVRVNGWERKVVSPKRVTREPNQPSALLWRDVKVISSNDFAQAAVALRRAAEIDAISPEVIGFEEGSVEEIRNWMAKYVKVRGPRLYELPIGAQLTDPVVVLKERYATRLDYVRTMIALLRGAGVDADMVFSADNSAAPEELRQMNMYEKPNVRAFSAALCRVKIHEGGWFGIGEKTRFIYIGTENQYTPIGASAYAGSDCFDPKTEKFFRIEMPQKMKDRICERSEYLVRADGAVDLMVENLIYGVGVGTFRKTYAEILPENRFRRYQSILGEIAQAAIATSELETDVESYPAVRKFSCHIPDYATLQNDSITLQLPPLITPIPSCPGETRHTPFALGAGDAQLEEVTIRFPRGYTEIEHLPENFELADTKSPAHLWIVNKVEELCKDGELVIKVTRMVDDRSYEWYSPEFYELLRDWNRICVSRDNHTITVRRPERESVRRQ